MPAMTQTAYAARTVVLQKLFKNRAFVLISSPSRSNSKNLRHEFCTSFNISFFDSYHLSFMQHIHDLVSSYRSPSRVEPVKPHSWFSQSLNEAMLLLNLVIEIFVLS